MIGHFTEFMIDATLSNYAVETIVDGERVRGTTTTTPIKVIIPQAIKADELNIDASRGEYASDFRQTWCSRSYNILMRDGATEPSELTIGGEAYTVFSVDPRLEDDFTKVIMKRKRGK